MKIRYPIIGIITILIIGTIAKYIVGIETYKAIGQPIAGILFIACLGLIAYLIVRNIFRSIKGAVTGTRAGDYQGEARKACEKVTPKRKKNATPPWEE